MKQTISIEAAAAPYSAIPVWEALPIQLAGTGCAVGGEQAQPIAPKSSVVKRFEPVARVGNANRHFSGPRALAILPLQTSLMPSSVSPLFPQKSISTLDSRKKPGNLTIPGSGRLAAINLASESGLIDGLPPGLGLPPAFPVDPVVQTGKGSWRAASRRPSAPNVAWLGAISFPLKSVPPAHFPGRRQPVGENVVPCRSWYSLTRLSESPQGFVFAPPPAATSSTASIGRSAPFGTWKRRTNNEFPGLSLLEQSGVCEETPQPTYAGARTLLPLIKPRTSRLSFQPGLTGALQGDEPFLNDESPFIRDVEKVPPASHAAEAPRPGMAFSTGFLAWIDPVNSYVRRNPGAPRFRDNSRIVHAMRLAPAGNF